MNPEQPTDSTADMNWNISETLTKLEEKEYTLKFRREPTCIYCFELNEYITPANFTVDNHYYFEDILNPDADRIVYAISLSQGGKGYLIDACNVYVDNINREMMQKLILDKKKP